MDKNDLFEEVYVNLKKEFDENFVYDIKSLINSNKFNKKNYLKVLEENFHE